MRAAAGSAFSGRGPEAGVSWLPAGRKGPGAGLAASGNRREAGGPVRAPRQPPLLQEGVLALSAAGRCESRGARVPGRTGDGEILGHLPQSDFCELAGGWGEQKANPWEKN